MSRRATSLTIDCATCPVQDVGCGDCMVSVLRPPVDLEEPDTAGGLPLDRREREVVSRLVASGLVSAENATRARARREPWSEYDAVTAVADRVG